MKSFAWYDLQVIICSAIMMSYYFLVLRNKKFHQYNRFYILAVFFLSFIIPLVKIQLDKMNADNTAVQFIYVLADYNVEMDKAVAGKGFQLSWNMMAIVGYTTVSVFFLFTFIIALLRIKKLLKQYSCKSLGEIYLIFTNVKGTPFSFFKYIFWNEEIDLQSSTGQQILQHELTHVKEKHSVDNIITQVVMIFGWFNPFFWWARKELHMIHEFIADKKSVDNGDASSLAEMLLAATYPQQQFLLTNSFFFSPIKRRLLMITNNKNPRFSYLRRLVVLPLMAVVVLLFAFRMKEQNAKNNLSNNQSAYSDTSRNTAGDGFLNESVNDIVTPISSQADFEKTKLASGDGVTQSDIEKYENILHNPRRKTFGNKSYSYYLSLGDMNTLYSIYKSMTDEQRAKVTKTNLIPGPRVPSIKTPSENQLNSWKDEKNYGVWIDGLRVKNTELNNYKATDFADYYVSSLTEFERKNKTYLYHLNLETMSYYDAHYKGFEYFADINLIKKADTSQVRVVFDNKKFAVKYNDTIPANSKVVITNNDPILSKALFVVDGVKQNRNVLHEINPNEIDQINVLKNMPAILKYGDEGKNGVIEITTKKKPTTSIKVENAKIFDVPNDSVMLVIDGDKILAHHILYNINPNDIESTNVLKGKLAIDKYGNEGKNGVIEITTKKKLNGNQIPSRTEANKKDAAESYDKVFTQTQIPAEFPGGKEAWMKYLVKNLKRDLPVKNGAGPGKYKVELSFIVDANGGISDIKAENDPGFGTAEEAIRMIKNGPAWVPAKQNGINVTSEAKQTITFIISDENETYDKVFTQTQVPAEFPGGITAWRKYLERNLDVKLPVKNGAGPGKYAVQLSFKVDDKGIVSDVKAENDPGFGTAEEAIRMIKKGPMWIPAKQNGKSVTSLVKLPITFVVSK